MCAGKLIFLLLPSLRLEALRNTTCCIRVFASCKVCGQTACRLLRRCWNTPVESLFTSKIAVLPVSLRYSSRCGFTMHRPSTELRSNSSDRELPRDMFRFNPSRICLVIQELICIVLFGGSYSEPKGNSSQRPCTGQPHTACLLICQYHGLHRVYNI